MADADAAEVRIGLAAPSREPERTHAPSESSGPRRRGWETSPGWRSVPGRHDLCYVAGMASRWVARILPVVLLAAAFSVAPCSDMSGPCSGMVRQSDGGPSLTCCTAHGHAAVSPLPAVTASVASSDAYVPVPSFMPLADLRAPGQPLFLTSAAPPGGFQSGDILFRLATLLI
jgi:hypothetical protein